MTVLAPTRSMPFIKPLLRLPTWLHLLLIPFVFLGGCTASLRPVWWLIEQDSIQTVPATETRHYPVLGRAADGKYRVVDLDDIPAGTSIVYSISSSDEAAINRDLRASAGHDGDYRYFRILTQTPAATEVLLQVPTTRTRMEKSWYKLSAGALTPQRKLLYGPGFAFAALLGSACVGFGCVVLYLVFVRRKKRLPHGSAPTPPPEGLSQAQT